MKRLSRLALLCTTLSSCVCSSPAPEVTKSKTVRVATADPDTDSDGKAKPNITVEKLRTAIERTGTPAQRAAAEAEALYRLPVEENFTALAAQKINERTNLNLELDRL